MEKKIRAKSGVFPFAGRKEFVNGFFKPSSLKRTFFQLIELFRGMLIFHSARSHFGLLLGKYLVSVKIKAGQQTLGH